MAKHGILNWSDCLIGVLVIFLFCVTLFLNILALHYTYSKIRKPSNKKIPHLLVGALSLGGLGIALFEYPPFIASRFNGEWLNESAVCTFVAFIIVLFGNLTICLVVLMSLERLGAIVFPFYYKEHVNFRKAVVVLVLVIIYSLLLASLPIFLDRIQLNVSTGVCMYAVDTHNTNTRIVVAVMVAHYIASILLMFISNMVVVRTVSKLDKNTMSDEYSSRSGGRKHGSNACLNFAKMVGVLAFCYTVCWTIILMRILLRYVYGWKNYYYDQVVIVLTTFDPLINHCVCLWIMRKYRDGYANSMGSLVSCFKISDDGIWATTITRLSTMSRRSTYSRASTRSSSRQPASKPYVYKQVPQNLDGNQPPDLLPEFDDQQAGQFAGLKVPDNEVKESEKRGGLEKRIYSDTNKDWSDLIRELNAEKNDKTSSRGSSEFQANKIEPIFEASQEGTSREYKTKGKWLDIIAKHKAQQQKDLERKSLDISDKNAGDFDATARGSQLEAAQQPTMNKKENLPELLQGIQEEKASVSPELLPYGGTSSDVSPIPELLQDIESSQDGTRTMDTEPQNKDPSAQYDATTQEAEQDDGRTDDQDQDQNKTDKSKG